MQPVHVEGGFHTAMTTPGKLGNLLVVLSRFSRFVIQLSTLLLKDRRRHRRRASPPGTLPYYLFLHYSHWANTLPSTPSPPLFPQPHRSRIILASSLHQAAAIVQLCAPSFVLLSLSVLFLLCCTLLFDYVIVKEILDNLFSLHKLCDPCVHECLRFHLCQKYSRFR